MARPVCGCSASAKSDSRPASGWLQWRDRAGFPPASFEGRIGVRRFPVSCQRESLALLLTLIAHAPTAATRRAAFACPTDALDPAGKRAAAAARNRMRRVDASLASPALAARQTAEAVGLMAHIEPALREVDYGRWAGRTLDEVAATEPEAVSTWLSDPAATPHGGEPIVTVLHRVAEWLRTLESPDRLVAVTHPSVLRAAVLAALHAPPAAFWRVEAGPLGRVRLRGSRLGWVLVGCGREGA